MLFRSHHRPQMATVRPKVLKKLEPVPCRKGKIVKEFLDIQENTLTTQVLEIIKEVQNMKHIADAKIVVAGGRGMVDKNGFALLEELANVLGAVLGGSRKAVEAGRVDVMHQIGQTGFTIAPNIYIAVGISGAIQHLVGVAHTRTIISINTNADRKSTRLNSSH